MSEMARRRDRIVNLLSLYGPLSAQALAERLEVSVQTLRTDLRDLDEAGVIRRRHGAASLPPQENIGYQPRLALGRGEKTRIAAAVAALIPAGARLALGTGTTVEEVARALCERANLFVATNNIHALMALRPAPGLSVQLAGGAVRLRDMDVIGADAHDFFRPFRLDWAVFSCGGVSETGEVLDFNMDELRAREAIAGAAACRVLVFDSAKIGRAVPMGAGRIWDYEVVVHAGVLPDPVRAACTEADCRLIPV
ncbi:DeoR/GlpR family DNA-binding transcription regulator [Pseudooceanicola sp. CBS1P-1]|uniref:DeoR family transcriptional regulator n=1 Tax=Pseudooceanicola albus TaxID=2692189 RepID=A0A6L7G1M3_9RHOB|nr:MULTISPECIES: DeoR/GlpR family DNA-binding transcription regulator [Pseudooceanicola]MBT9383500.1 DeoR/GlpR family DNA-binding transcription regulator [Pseudooceanicola endophyticus]MXN17356.1 DeoR family transcriptional regulator [Pseudooceanicola albus]